MEKYIEYLSVKELSNVLRKKIDENTIVTLGMDLGHTEKLHAGQSDREMLQRIVTENRAAISSFKDNATAYENISLAAYFQAGKIASWLQTDRHKCHSNEEYLRLVLCTDMEEPVGTGFKNDGKEYESSYVRLVLDRDRKAPYGFHLKTAYVDIELGTAEPTGKSYTKEEALSMVQKKPSIYQETAFLRNGETDGVTVRATKGKNDREYLQVYSNIRGAEYTAFMNVQGQAVIFKQRDSLRETIKEEEAPAKLVSEVRRCRELMKNLDLSRTSFESLAKDGNTAPKMDEKPRKVKEKAAVVR